MPPVPKAPKPGFMMPNEWMPEDPEVADVATWGQNDPPKYTEQLPEKQRVAAEERIAAQVAKTNLPPKPPSEDDEDAVEVDETAKSVRDFLDS